MYCDRNLFFLQLLVTIVHTDPYIINSENFKNINEQLKNGCVLVQGYDAYGTQNSDSEHFEAFPFNYSGKIILSIFHMRETISIKFAYFSIISDPSKQKWINHRGVQKLEEILNLKETCGYITFIKTGVRDIGCENYDVNVHLVKSKRSLGVKEQRIQKQNAGPPSSLNYMVRQ